MATQSKETKSTATVLRNALTFFISKSFLCGHALLCIVNGGNNADGVDASDKTYCYYFICSYVIIRHRPCELDVSKQFFTLHIFCYGYAQYYATLLLCYIYAICFLTFFCQAGENELDL